MQVISLYKPIGLTPFQMITGVRARFPHLSDKKIGYAGRLDPMAEGVLLLLVGDENKKRRVYENLDKSYTFDLIPGLTTDTYDLLGHVQTVSLPTLPVEQSLIQLLPGFLGKLKQQYPPFSSKTVSGEPLYRLAREKRLPETLPEKEITILSLLHVSTQLLNAADLLGYIQKNFPKDGTFRQYEILTQWESIIPTLKTPLQKYTLNISASSGVYVRSLVYRLGEALGCGAVTFCITRTSVGEYTLDQALRI